MDIHEAHAHRHADTGHRWLDITLGVAALTVSAISLYVAVHHGQTMEKLVEANSFPNVEVSVDLGDGHTPSTVILKIVAENNGVGPARVETLEFWDGAQPLETAGAMISAIKARGDGRKLDARLSGVSVVGSLVGAGKVREVVAFETDRTAWFAPAARFSARLRDRVCYCSVFDECFVSDSAVERGRAQHVKSCPTPAHPYQDDVSGFVATALDKPAT